MEETTFTFLKKSQMKSQKKSQMKSQKKSQMKSQKKSQMKSQKKSQMKSDKKKELDNILEEYSVKPHNFDPNKPSPNAFMRKLEIRMKMYYRDLYKSYN
jgi:hypothetical protein